ncbi:MAG: tetratricopeptide repeat protein [Elusimicrobiota bacterium]
MSEAYSAVLDDSFALFYNPAGLSNLNRLEVGSMYSQLYYGLDDGSNWSNQSLAAAYPINKKNGLGLGWHGKDFSELYWENTFLAGYGYKIAKNLAVGINLKARQKKYGANEWVDLNPSFAAKRKITRFSSDLGFLLAAGESSWGVSVQDFTRPDVGLFDKTVLPMTVRLGYAYRVSRSFKIASDWVSRKKDYEMNLGWENEFLGKMNGVCLRGGVSLGNDQYKQLSLGLGYLFNKFFPLRLDYAFNYPLSGIEGTAGSHLFSLNMKFGENKHLTKQERGIIRQKEEKDKKEKIRLNNEYAQALTFYKENCLIQAYETFDNIINGSAQNIPEIIANCKKHRTLILNQMEELVNRGSKSLDYNYAQGFIHYMKKDYKNTLTSWDKITVLNQHFPEVTLYIDKARKIIENLEKIKTREKKTNAENLFNTGKVLFDKGYYAEAILYFQSSYNFESKEETGIYLKRCRIRLQEKLDKPVIKIENKHMGRKAAEPKNKITEAENKTAKTEELLNNGIIEYRMGNFQKASNYFTEALRFDPDNENIKIYKKRAETRLRKNGELMDKTDEEKINTFYKQGVMKYMNGDLTGAIKIWEEILTINPNDEKVINSLIKVRKELEIK